MNSARDGVEPDIRHLQLPPDTLRVLQITDTHLYAEPGSRLLGVNTLDSFRTVIEAFKETDWQTDMVLATGDLVHDASPRGYRDLANTLDHFEQPVLCLPGNHDLPDVMREHLRSERVSTPHVADIGAWRFVMLDSVIPGEVGGHLQEREFDYLRDALSDNTRPTLVCLHHQPVPVGSQWIDNMGLDNAEKLMQIVEKSPAVRGVLWGHVHQRYDGTHKHLRLMATPSTCVQFSVNSDDFAVDQAPPGFRLLALLPDGTIHTQVVRTPEMPAGLNLASSGYK
jgi:Icc protein